MEHQNFDHRLGVFNKYLEIKKDIMQNLFEVYNRQHYYTHKYRGNILLDVNVAVGDYYEDSTKKEIQIFVRFKDLYIKDNIIYTEKPITGYFNSTIKTNLHE